MKTSNLLRALIFLIGIARVAYAQDFDKKAAPPANPADAHVVLELDKPQYFLGENILLHFRVENRGAEPFVISMGGDYRGAARHLRFKISAIRLDGNAEERGKTVADPYPGTMNFGGMFGSSTVDPGGHYYDSLALMSYCRFDLPGTYRVTATHDLGWPAGKAPVGATTIKLLMPTPAQAAAVLAEMKGLTRDGGVLIGTKGRPFADFSTLRYPVYLPLLRTEAQKGSREALEGIGNIAIPEATQALIDLAATEAPPASDKDWQPRATELLAGRLPIPAEAPANPFVGPSTQHDWLVQQSWRSEFAPAVRAVGRRLVVRDNQISLRCGASMLESIGTIADIGEVHLALQARLEKSVRIPRVRSMDSRDDPGWPIQDDILQLLSTAKALCKSAKRAPDLPVNDASQLIDISTLPPAEFQTSAAVLLHHRIPFMRQWALENLKPPLADSVMQQLSALIADSDVQVQTSAVALAGKTGDRRFAEPILQVLATSRGYWLMDTVGYTAPKLGVPYEAWEIWANRLNEPDMMVAAILHLAEVTGSNISGYRTDLPANTGAALQPKWQAFLKAHRAELLTGKRFPIGSPEITPDLFPPHFQFQTPKGMWPLDK